jgi:hypothetical protein
VCGWSNRWQEYEAGGQDDWEQEFVVNGWMVGGKKLKWEGGMIDVSCFE